MRVGQDALVLSRLVPETEQRMWHTRLCISKKPPTGVDAYRYLKEQSGKLAPANAEIAS